MEALVSAMNSELTEDQRHVIILRFLEDFSLKETAQVIGKEVNNVKVIQNRGITKLRKALEHHLDDDEQDLP
jgi:RNA polymerase sigma-70 factor (ECF subfamily)